MKKDWTEIMRDKLSESAVTPPGDLWGDISSELDAIAASKKKNVTHLIWRYVTVAAILAVVVVCGIYFYDFDRGAEAVKEVLAQNYQGVGAANSHKHEEVSTGSGKSMKVLGGDTSAGASKDAYVPADGASRDAYVPADDANRDAYVPADGASKDAYVPADDASKDAYVPADDASRDAYVPAEPIAKHRKSLSLSFFASNTNMPNPETNGDYAAIPGDIGNGNMGSNDPPIYDPPLYGDLTGADDTDESDMSQSRLSDSYTVRDARHKQPLRFGLSARIPISDSFSIGTGVTYSLLSSNITLANTSNMTYNVDQTLHYIGIPLSIEYNLPSYHSFGFYLTAGTMVEKCIYGESRVSNWPTKESVKEKELQLSIFAGAGLQLNLNDHIALYAEPLATYYFNNHSSVTNIYKDRPLNIDLRIGLRYTLK